MTQELMIAQLTPQEQGRLIRLHAKVAVSERRALIAALAAQLVNYGICSDLDRAIPEAQALVLGGSAVA